MSSLTVDTQQLKTMGKNSDTAAVFEGTSFEALSRDIGILTSTLAHLPAAPPTSSGRSKGSAEGTGGRAHKDGDNGVSSLLGHISTLLTVSTAGDKFVATVNAVIGQYEPGGGISVVVSYNGKVTADPSTSPRTPSLQPVLIGDDQRARDLLDPDQSSQMQTGTLAIQDHLGDVGTVLTYILKVPLSQRKSSVAHALFCDLFCFIVRRAHVKLGARFSNMEQFWNKKNPVQIMLDSWAMDGIPHFNDVVDVPGVGLHIELLKKHHIVPLDFNPQTDKVFVTTENAKHWLEASIELLNALKSALCDGAGKPVACPSFDQIREILLASFHLDFILKSFFKIVSNKAPRRVEEELQSNYTTGMENRLRKRDVWRKIQAGELPAVPDAASELDEETTLMDSPIQESGESSVSHVQRFLRTLTAWYTACNVLFYHAPGRMDIGVSKKCCYCCDILANLINTSPQGGLTFLIPGTHGTIFPWHPPPLGINTEHLQQMRDKLFKKFHDIVTKQILGLASTQSSPVSDYEVLEEEEYKENWAASVGAWHSATKRDD
ncbi:hypothetical protein BD413DRAFT_288419 [Trametes elegans]|nr:hypothetical protein BD413DRAFT_288419 [Trametes elegans]